MNQASFSIQPQLYIGDLDAGIREVDVFEVVKPYGDVAMIKLMRSKITNKAFAFVAYKDLNSSFKARQALNGTKLAGSVIRACKVTKDRNPSANVFIKNIPASATLQSLEQHFSIFGSVLSSKIVYSPQGFSLGYGFVQYESPAEAAKALKSMNGFLWENCKLEVSEYLPISSRPLQSRTNLYIKNFPSSFTQDDIKTIFSVFGEIFSVAIVHTPQSEGSKTFGFVGFISEASAKQACEAMHNKKQNDFEWYVAPHMNKIVRKAYLRDLYLQQIEDWKRKNLYIRNLHTSICENKLKDIFQTYGSITSVKIVQIEHVKYSAEGDMYKEIESKGVGFVCFSEEIAAVNALKDFQDKVVEGKKLFIAKWKPRSELRAGILEKKRAGAKVWAANQKLEQIVKGEFRRTVPMPLMRMPGPIVTERDEIGNRVYKEVIRNVHSSLTVQVTKEIMDMGKVDVCKLLESEQQLREKIFEVVEKLTKAPNN